MSASSLFSGPNYQSAFQAMMPRGRVWSGDPLAVQSLTIGALALTYQRSDQAAVQLLVDAFPATANAMLPEWDATLGLPDAAAGPAPNLAKHQQQVLARFTDGGGQSIAYYTAWAAQFGITVTVQNYAAFRVGQSRVGQPLCGAGWAYALNVTIPSSGTYAAWDLTMLTDSLQARAPAHGLLTVTPA